VDEESVTVKISKHAATDITEFIVLANPFTVTTWFP
jgi:hypothetical protein